VTLLEEHEDEDDLAGGEENQERSMVNKDRPAHTRKPKQQGSGMCWSFHFALYVQNSFAGHVYYIRFIC